MFVILFDDTFINQKRLPEKWVLYSSTSVLLPFFILFADIVIIYGLCDYIASPKDKLRWYGMNFSRLKPREGRSII